MKRLFATILILVLTMSLLAACGQNDGAPAAPPGAPPGAPAGTPTPATQDPAAPAAQDGETEETPEGPPAPGTPLRGGTLITGFHVVDAQLVAINPFLPLQTAFQVLDLMYERLLFFNYVTGELMPMLATGYEWSADFMQLTFTIRDGVTWHDGQPFTAEDVVFTFEALRDNPVLDRFALWNVINSVSASGNNVVVNLDTPFLSFPFYMHEVRIVPAHIWSNVPDVVTELNERPIGTGPFIWRSHTVGTDVQFDANPNYWGGAPYVDELLFLTFSTAPALSLAMLNNDMHTSFGLAMPMIPEFRTIPGATIQIMSGLNMWAVNVNHEDPLLSDPIVRRAMAMAINQNDLIHRVEHSVVFPTSPGFLPMVFGDLVCQTAFNSLDFDPAGAVELLESAGFERGTDGVFATPDGRRLSFTYHNASGAPAQQMAAGMIQQWLLNIGIEILPRLATWPELTRMLETGEFQLLQNQIVVPPDPFAALNSVFHSSMTAPTGTTTPGLNYFRYRNPVVDALLDEAAISTDEARRRAIFFEIQNIIAEDAVFLPMYNTGPRHFFFDGPFLGGFADDVPILSNFGIIQIHWVQQ